jgi:hypothetical protein
MKLSKDTIKYLNKACKLAFPTIDGEKRFNWRKVLNSKIRIGDSEERLKIEFHHMIHMIYYNLSLIDHPSKDLITKKLWDSLDLTTQETVFSFFSKDENSIKEVNEDIFKENKTKIIDLFLKAKQDLSHKIDILNCQSLLGEADMDLLNQLKNEVTTLNDLIKKEEETSYEQYLNEEKRKQNIILDNEKQKEKE